MPQTININGQEIPIEQFRNDWALVLMSQGVIAKLSLSRWRATARLTPDLLGLKFTEDNGFEFMNRYIDLGKQRLLPPEILENVTTLENKARSTLSTYSFSTIWGNFIPFTAFDEWEKLNNSIRNDYMAQALLIGSKYKEIVSIVKEEYKSMAKDVWHRLYPDDKSGATPSFIDNFVAKVVEKIPPQEEIVSSFKYDTTYFIIPMPSFVQENIARAEKIRLQSEVERFNSELEKKTKQRISEEYIKRKKELIDGFLESTVFSMRKYVSELCDDVLKSIGQQKSNSIKSKNINRLKFMIKRVRIINFYDDKEVSRLLNDLEIEIDKVKGETEKDIVVEKLREIVEVGKKEFVPKNFNPSISVLEV